MPAFGLNPALPADQLNAFGQITPGSPSFNAVFAGAVAANIDAVRAGTVATVASAFSTAGNQFDGAASRLYPVFGVQESQTSPDDGISCTQQLVIEDTLVRDLTLVVMLI